MEQLKVKRKGRIVYNVIFHLILSFFFLYIQHAYRHHISPFSTVYLQKGMELFWYVVLTLGLSSILIWRHHKSSIFFYQVSILLVAFKITEGLFVEFNKVIVITMFLFFIISYFLYQFLNSYYESAFINPNYSQDDLFDPLLRDIPCELRTGKENIRGILTNWDDEGCFIKFDQTINKAPRRIELMIEFKGREFVQKGEVVAQTYSKDGFGIKFNESQKSLDVFNWSEFIEIIHELGFRPERLR